MTIRHLRIFVEVAETGKMSAAAEHCFLSQPTVSQAIRELEEHYKVRLFERLSKKLYITEAGRQLLIYARKVLSQYDLLESNMKDFRMDNQIRIGATITVGACLLSSILNDLKQQQPQLRTYSCVANTSQIEKKLLNSELDVGIIEGCVTSPDLITIPVVEDSLILAVSNDHPLAQKKLVDIHELSAYEFVMREKGSGTRKLFEDYMAKHGVSFPIVCEATCLDAIKGAVLYNECISPISIRLMEREIADGQIYIFRSSENAWERQFYLVYHKDKIFSEPMRILESILHKYKCPEFPGNECTGILTCG